MLGYVTPWNGKGYDVADVFSPKFDFVSPVWLQIKPENGKYAMHGMHDIDKGWVSRVRQSRGSGKNTLVLPRVLFDGWSGQDYSELFSRAKAVPAAVKTIVKEITVSELNRYPLHSTASQKKKLDGVVLEVWSQLGGHAQLQKSELRRIDVI